jgi:hypothetical protein
VRTDGGDISTNNQESQPTQNDTTTKEGRRGRRTEGGYDVVMEENGGESIDNNVQHLSKQQNTGKEGGEGEDG